MGAVVGAGAAAGLHALGRADSVYVLAVAGAVLGAVAGWWAGRYNRTVRLSEVRVSVPQLSELTFVVNDATRDVAWQLFVESATRISTQRLDEDEGLVGEGMASLYSLFSTTREILRAAGPSVHVDGITVEYLAVNLLNRELRPFLSTWHPRLTEFERLHGDLPESAWPQLAACRADLTRVRIHTREYVLGFARLAGVRDPELMVGDTTGGAPA